MADRHLGADSRKGQAFRAADFLEFSENETFSGYSGDFRKSGQKDIEYVLLQVIESARPALQKFDEDEEEFARFQPQRQRNRG